MGTTAKGIVFPDPSGVPSRAAFEELAESADDAIGASVGAVLDRGRLSVTTNASGVASISHSLGRNPVYASAETLSNVVRAVVTSTSDTALTVHVVTATTGANYSGSVTLMWLVA